MAGMGNMPPLKECYEDVEYVVIGAGKIQINFWNLYGKQVTNKTKFCDNIQVCLELEHCQHT